MFTIRETAERTDVIFPEEASLYGYEGLDFGKMLDMVRSKTGLGCQLLRIGDSSVVMRITPTFEQGQEGVKRLKNAAVNMKVLIEKALPEMGKPYRDFYRHFLDDFERNGLIMPSMNETS